MDVETTDKNNFVNQLRKTIFKIYKRIFDVLFSVLLAIFVSPIILFFLIIIPLESQGNPIYSQKRVGLNGKEFMLYKLRSMEINAERNGAKWADKNDVRITNIGKFIRTTRIDELPQLVNVLKGEMSFIGPRPERKVFIDEFLIEIPNFNERLLVKPGLTGWAQVNGGYEITPQEKLELDIFYIMNQSLKLDLKILCKTFIVVTTGKGAR